MADWNFIPWTIQYLIAVAMVMLISFHIVSKNFKSWTYRSFFFFGISVGSWELFAFLHRNAPTAAMSMEFLGLDTFFGVLTPAFLLAMFLTLLRDGERLHNYLILVPSLILGILAILTKPFEVFWTNFGWGYRFTFGWFVTSFALLILIYVFSIVISAGMLIRRSKTTTSRKRYIGVLAGFIAFYTIGMSISNFILSSNPNIPPLGGIFIILTFLAVAYSFILPPEKIMEKRVFGTKKMTLVQDQFRKFLVDLLKAVPGKELGENTVIFRRFLDRTGLNEVVSFKEGQIIFEEDKLPSLNLLDSLNKILDYMKRQVWAIAAIENFAELFVHAYETVSLTSKFDADNWLDRILRRHGVFLSNYGVLDKMPKDVDLPPIFKLLKPGVARIFEEEEPILGYTTLKDATRYGFRTVCVSRFEPKKVRQTYGLSDSTIVWVTFGKTEEEAMPPDKLDALKVMISELDAVSVVLLDCFVEIKIVNGFEKAISFLKEIKDLCRKKRLALLVSIDPRKFLGEQLVALEQQLERVEAL